MTSFELGRSFPQCYVSYSSFIPALLHPIKYIFFTLLLSVGLVFAAQYRKSAPNLCGYYAGTSSGCPSITTYCTTGNYFPARVCGASSVSCVAETSSASCAVCGNCAGGSDTCNAVACGTTNSYGCGAGSYCNGATGAGSCNAQFGTGAACNCSSQCTSGVCTGNLCQAKYQSGTNLCGYYTGTSASCGAANTYCTAGNYYPTQACSATPTYTVCQAETSSASCAVCGDCAGGSDTCGTATCGTTYGCASGICDGVGTGANHCLATFGTGAACNCSSQCTSGVCTDNVCQAKYQSATNLCGYYTGTNPSCAAANNFCAAGTYYPTQSCSATPTYTVCQAETSSASCAVCGDCAGGADTCNAVACGTTNSYGCGAGSYCNGATGAGSCNAQFGTGAACNCSSQCTSDVCTGNLCQAKYQSGTNQCGYYTGTSASCGAANNFCTTSTYYPSQACSATPTYTVCQTADATHSCGGTVCGMCSGSADTCGTATCGTTYGCAGGNVCNGQGTGAGNCVAPAGNGTTCYCDAMCTTGYGCVSNACKGNIVGFTITLPGPLTIPAAEGGNATADIEFNLTGGNTASNVAPCLAGTSTCQTSGTPIFVFTNTGTATLNWYVYLDTALPASMTLKGDTDNNPSGATTITTAGWLVASSIAPSGSQNAWLWTDFSGATVSDVTSRTIKNNATST